MRKIVIFILLSSFVFVLTGCNPLVSRKKCLNYENLDSFYYNNHLYTRPENYEDIYYNYDFYGEKHKVGYTIGVHYKIFDTYALDIDVEENVLFQEESFNFWFKEGFEFPDVSKMSISKLLIEKRDSWYNLLEKKEYLLDNIFLDDLFIEYNVDSNADSYLLDYHNFSTYRIRYIYGDWICSSFYNGITIYNEKIFVEIFNQSLRTREIYVLNENYAESIYRFIIGNLK